MRMLLSAILVLSGSQAFAQSAGDNIYRDCCAACHNPHPVR